MNERTLMVGKHNAGRLRDFYVAAKMARFDLIMVENPWSHPLLTLQLQAQDFEGAGDQVREGVDPLQRQGFVVQF